MGKIAHLEARSTLATHIEPAAIALRREEYLVVTALYHFGKVRMTEPQPRAAIIYTEIGAVESEASSGSLTTAGLAAVRFDSRRSDTRSRRDRRRPCPRRKPSRCARLCIAHGITTAAGNHRGRHYLTTRPCLDRRAVGSHGRPGAILAFLSVGAGDNRGGLQHVRLQPTQC
jgi:hypothetical protein